ncbi:C40 family peptidase [Streptomyces sp. NBC_00344]|uniref:C40 family peptidase n=1 Tax=Streptomyces sp. NBC_00344 TaxID=2975720 RepID=UPI002E1AC326
MSGRLLRFIGTTAVIGSVVTASPALADPEAPGPATAGPATTRPATAPPATARPATAAELLERLRSLYQRSEAAGQSYTAATEALGRQRAAARKTGAGLTKARTELIRSREAAGQLAREQYQGRSDLSPYLLLMLAEDPQQALDANHEIKRASADRMAKIRRLRSVEHRALVLATRSNAALIAQQKLAARRRKAHETAEARLRDAEALLAGFTPDQAADVAALDKADTDAAQKELVDSGGLSGPPAAVSAQGNAAVTYAMAQIGKPYVWGTAGPKAFDCSGLTLRAWAEAGRRIPRTSEEQWRQLPKVALTALRPGDLIVYFPEATHVALYVGGGKVVQAPRPGGRITVSPMAFGPILGAVRPGSASAVDPVPAGAGGATRPAQVPDTSAR